MYSGGFVLCAFVCKNIERWINRKRGTKMEPLKDLLLYVSSVCADCGHRWESDAFAGKCPECHSGNITQNAMTRGL